MAAYCCQSMKYNDKKKDLKRYFTKTQKAVKYTGVYFTTHLTNRGSSWSAQEGSKGKMSAKNVTACNILLGVLKHIADLLLFFCCVN